MSEYHLGLHVEMRCDAEGFQPRLGCLGGKSILYSYPPTKKKFLTTNYMTFQLDIIDILDRPNNSKGLAAGLRVRKV